MARYNLTKKRAREILLEFVGHMPLVEEPIPVAVKGAKKSPKIPKVKRPKQRKGGFGEFYESREWFELRYAVLKQYGARCMICGATRSKGVTMHVDHIKPRSKYPELELERSNLQVLCRPCNLGKSNKDETDWRYPPGLRAYTALTKGDHGGPGLPKRGSSTNWDYSRMRLMLPKHTTSWLKNFSESSQI